MVVFAIDHVGKYKATKIKELLSAIEGQN